MDRVDAGVEEFEVFWSDGGRVDHSEEGSQCGGGAGGIFAKPLADSIDGVGFLGKARQQCHKGIQIGGHALGDEGEGRLEAQQGRGVLFGHAFEGGTDRIG